VARVRGRGETVGGAIRFGWRARNRHGGHAATGPL